MTTSFELRKVYNFDVYPAALLGNDFKNVTVLAIMDRETANKEIDCQALHINYYPSLPVGTPNDPNGYDYVRIKTTAGQITVLGMAWINADSVQLVESRTAKITVGNIGAADIPRIRNALVQNGYNNIEIQLV